MLSANRQCIHIKQHTLRLEQFAMPNILHQWRHLTLNSELPGANSSLLEHVYLVLSLRLVKHILCLEQYHSCLFQPLGGYFPSLKQNPDCLRQTIVPTTFKIKRCSFHAILTCLLLFSAIEVVFH